MKVFKRKDKSQKRSNLKRWAHNLFQSHQSKNQYKSTTRPPRTYLLMIRGKSHNTLRMTPYT